MSSANTYRDTTSADFLNEMRKELAQKKASDSRSSSPTPSYIIPAPTQVEVTDEALVNQNLREELDYVNAEAKLTQHTLKTVFGCVGGGAIVFMAQSGAPKLSDCVGGTGGFTNTYEAAYCGFSECA